MLFRGNFDFWIKFSKMIYKCKILNIFTWLHKCKHQVLHIRERVWSNPFHPDLVRFVTSSVRESLRRILFYRPAPWRAGQNSPVGKQLSELKNKTVLPHANFKTRTYLEYFKIKDSSFRKIELVLAPCMHLHLAICAQKWCKVQSYKKMLLMVIFVSGYKVGCHSLAYWVWIIFTFNFKKSYLVYPSPDFFSQLISSTAPFQDTP